jgi:hypothetical protein
LAPLTHTAQGEKSVLTPAIDTVGAGGIAGKVSEYSPYRWSGLTTRSFITQAAAALHPDGGEFEGS